MRHWVLGVNQVDPSQGTATQTQEAQALDGSEPCNQCRIERHLTRSRQQS